MSNEIKMHARGYFKRNDKSPEMIKIQTELKSLGFWTDVPFNENFGPASDTAVKKFQAAKGLKPDGLIGKDTLTALGFELVAQSKKAPSKEASAVGMCTTSYENLPVFDTYDANLLSYKAAVAYLNSNHAPAIAKAVFVLMGAESSHRDGKNFSSAGHYNYGGVQTDAGKWTGGMDKLFIGQFCRHDKEKFRMFAAFENNERFLDFMCDKFSAKGFADKEGADHWTERYINNWWRKNLDKQDIKKYNEAFPKKKAIYETWARKFDALK